MSHLPRVVDYANQPLALGKDFARDVSLIRERFIKHFPAYNYRSLVFEPTADPSKTNVTGKDGGTKMDPLWGESVPDNGNRKWEQPHKADGSPTEQTNNKYLGPFPINMRIRREASQKELQRWGFDRERQIYCVIPTSFLVDCNIEVKAGDLVEWNGPQKFRVEVYSGDGYWKNTNIPQYIVCGCDMLRVGS